jgi:LmbE family N-acetylglucosaminyl deacetylase
MLSNRHAHIFIPDGSTEERAYRRTTHVGISAHQDDLEIMAIDGILHCYQDPVDQFGGIVMTDGRGSPRLGVYANLSDEEMVQTRIKEQVVAAAKGKYSALVMLGYSSAKIKNPLQPDPVQNLVCLFRKMRPRVVYTHNLADKHATHVAVALRVIAALRQLEDAAQPEKVYGCEVWRGLDWMPDSDKVKFDCSGEIALQEELLKVFDSQISGGKRYDLATMGRRLANATYLESHETDTATHMSFAMDLTPLLHDKQRDIADYCCAYISAFEKDVRDTIQNLE